MKHKRQHFIPASYLQAWCDPELPKGQTPYIWLFSRDASEYRKKAPEKVFFEKDLYTIQTNDGERDLTLEYNLSRLEYEFSKLRKNKLNKRQTLSLRDRSILCMFVIAMYGRTKAYRDHWRQQWNGALALVEKMEQAIDNASPEERERMAATLCAPHPTYGDGLSIEDVRKRTDQPIQFSLPGLVTKMSPLLLKIPFLILEPTKGFGFITSDDPCVWYDPASYRKPIPYGAGGLISPTIEITCPLSPTQMIFFGKKLMANGLYLTVNDEDLVDSFNKRTRLSAQEYFVVNRPAVRLKWF